MIYIRFGKKNHMTIQELKWGLANLVVKEYRMLPVVEKRFMRLNNFLRDT